MKRNSITTLCLFLLCALTVACAPISATLQPGSESQPTPTSAPTEPAPTEPSEPETIDSTSTVTSTGLLPTVTPQPDATLAVPPEDEASARLVVPEGFAVRIFISDLRDPRLMDVAPDGALYVAERGANAVVRLVDEDNDGLADARVVVADRLDSPHSVEWYEDSLIVAEGGEVTRLTDLNGDGDMQDEGEAVRITAIPSGGGHSSRTAHVGPDGNLYVAAGSTSNISPERDPRRAAILRFALDGSIPADNPFAGDENEQRQSVYAEGLRNAVDFLFMPDGALWATHNGSDGLGDEIPHEEIVNQVESGRHYGWPYCYTPGLGAIPAGTEEVHDDRVDLDGPLSDCSQATVALFTDLAHQAPLGIAYYDQQTFPAEFQGDLYVTYHGSWNSGEPRDCRVQRIVVEDGLPIAAEPFVTGFRDSESEQCGQAWGRPAGVSVGVNGELFISDDQNGNIYRVVYVGS